MVACIINDHARDGCLRKFWVISDLAKCFLSTIALIYDKTLLVHLLLDNQLLLSGREDPQVSILQLDLMENIFIFWQWIFKLHA